MKYLVVGHRGVGKTSFLQSLKAEHEARGRACIVYDLDVEVESAAEKSVENIFKYDGEATFRQLENEVLIKLCDRHKDESLARPVFIALGAGFHFLSKDINEDQQFSSRLMDSFCSGWRILWLRRSSDKEGRVFLNRPRLSQMESPWLEYMELFPRREQFYKSICDEQIILREGEMGIGSAARKLLFGEPKVDIGGILTVLPKELSSPEGGASTLETQAKFKAWLGDRLSWGVERFELRTDILSDECLTAALEVLPPEKILLSLRTNKNLLAQQSERDNLLIDWAVELGDVFPDGVQIVSCHSVTSPDEPEIKGLELWAEQSPKRHIKAAPKVETWIELMRWHKWWSRNPAQRSFLPMSESGRWAWYRLLMKNKMKFNFWREGGGTAADQPTLAEWIDTPDNLKYFAAVLGSPIQHSYSPVFHRDFFAAQDAAFFAIDVRKEEFSTEVMNFLFSFGLRAAAVTSPLKVAAAEWLIKSSGMIANEEALNTLVYSTTQSQWIGFNTDKLGLAQWLPSHLMSLDGMSRGGVSQRLKVSSTNVVIWGGGGVLPSVQKICPGLVAYSARTGLAREEFLSVDNPEFVIWGVGRDMMTEAKWPPKSWRPQKIIDLNYSENSPGLEYALNCGAQHVRGDEFFRLQALEQQRVWSLVTS